MLGIVNYSMGNLRSVQKGFEQNGHAAAIVEDAAGVAAADKLVLPGMGAFRDAMRELNQRGLVEPIKQHITSGKPMLGICLGLQLLFETSYEDGEHAGLAVLPGRCVRFELPSDFKTPHMGWNQIIPRRPAPLLAGVEGSAYFYFVHSYYVQPTDPSHVLTETDYGALFCSSIWRDNVYATQFHPEKSQAVGLRVLKNFAEL